ncbi:MAG: cyclic nucleotide-binding protein [Betaproteobacteria bacterium RIFCSPLOWO2_02_FULL_63_19]|nr:MAG: cyclic nucleotide-binding protein [Betaproteobacteria bacterium RIFCSPLOWO2_02_FULL_63_19]
MLVALPSAIAFGVAIYSPLGGSFAAQGALAGILGTLAVGTVAAAFGGTNRLISAPCAPAAAVLSAVSIDLMHKGIAPESALVLLTLIGLMCGALQLAFGTVGLGRLIKYMPYPVVSGYLSGVGLIIIVSQIPKLLGVPKDIGFWKALISPTLWQWQGIVVGVVTVVVMVTAPKLTKAVPAAIIALVAGMLAYFGMSMADPSLLKVSGNPLIVGTFGGSDAGFLDGIVARWNGLSGVKAADIAAVVVPALTLAVLLSIDTLKTCVVLDALTRTRHDSNRELVGQGLGNLATTVVGGMQGAGQMGATLVNISSGGQTRVSGLIEGVLALAAMLALGDLIAWVPIAGLAGILIVIGVRMFDRHSLNLLKSRSTILDFMVIASVVVVAMTISLMAASGVGIALAIFLFVREQIGGSVVRRRSYGNQAFSKQVRLREEMEILEKRGDQTAIFELQGSLFFGTTDQLYTALEPELKIRRYIILDMRRVQTVDVTAVHMLEQIESTIAERNGSLIFSQLPRSLPSGRDMEQYFDQVGLMRAESHARVFDALDDALEWVENRILEEEVLARALEAPLELREIDLFEGRKDETLAELDACMEKRSYKAGERICARGDAGHEIFLIRRGAVRIVLPLTGKQGRHLATFGRGDFFGEMSFLDRDLRSADAYAFTDADLFVLPREQFDKFAEGHKKLAIRLMEGLARKLAIRLRYANAELRHLEES